MGSEATAVRSLSRVRTVDKASVRRRSSSNNNRLCSASTVVIV